jgi:hypothetical protein
MTEQAYNTAVNKIYALNCDTGDLGTTVLHHFRLNSDCSITGNEKCCITDYVNSYIIPTDSCGSTFSCADLNIVQVTPIEGAIIISQS